MGGGIWSMHFVAMLAFSIPGLEVGYDLRLTLLSLALPPLPGRVEAKPCSSMQRPIHHTQRYM
ncbi:MHYT domain protein [Methylorubrum extorquens DSM 13060]|uniref:MHYT domain protein n=1 Tax=Methylorubrum extorquens DSM 13060 TaxID=882800 RepID=H1KCX9_METEX|nr:MHYT domain protein [Methylorubrum extorquens DSM 13060]